jgi:hypothetical protein
MSFPQAQVKFKSSYETSMFDSSSQFVYQALDMKRKIKGVNTVVFLPHN